MEQNEAQVVYERIVKRLCETILIFEDGLGEEHINKFLSNEFLKDLKYLDDLWSDEINNSKTYPYLDEDSRDRIKRIVSVEVDEYINEYQTSLLTGRVYDEPFAFDTGGSFLSFRKDFFSKYDKMYDKMYSDTMSNVYCYDALHYIRNILVIVFEIIIQSSTEYRYIAKVFRTQTQVLENTISMDTQANIDVLYKKANDDIEERIKVMATHASDAEQSAKNAAKNAAFAVDKKVSKLEVELSKKVSETSVTILGIFSGIVITIVAGLFFSNAVMESINTANVFRLLLGSSVAGFVCFNMIATLVRYIDRFSSGRKNGTVDKKADDQKEKVSTNESTKDESTDSTTGSIITERICEFIKKVLSGIFKPITLLCELVKASDPTTVLVDTLLTISITVSTVGTCVTDFSGNSSAYASSVTNDSISVNVAVDGAEASYQTGNDSADGHISFNGGNITPSIITENTDEESDDTQDVNPSDNPDTGDIST